MRHLSPIWLAVTILLLASPSLLCARIRVSCIGDSITYGMRLEDREHDAYPVRLQEMLGDGYEVGNFGKSGATLLRHGHRPYMEQEEFRQALDFAGDICVIHLGINDTDPRDWPNYQDEFVGDYLALIDSLRSRNSSARFIVALMTPIGDSHPRFTSGTREYHAEIQEAIREVARISGADLIDFYTPLHRFPWMFPDAVHPNPEGARILAQTVYSGITGDFGGLSMAETYSDYMVLQKAEQIPICGWANAGEKVTVRLAGRKQRTQAGKDGRWSVSFEGLPYTRDTELKISTRERELRFSHVAIGEVWLCSGQSNMEFMLSQAKDAATDLAAAADPDLRLFNMQCRHRTDDVAWPLSFLDSLNHLQYFDMPGWKTASAETLRSFSAIGYYFGKALRDSLQVPVGLICNAVGGSTTESWVSRKTLETEFPLILRNWLYNDFTQDWARGRGRRNISAREAQSGQDYVREPNLARISRHPYEPCYLYEAGLLPLDHYPVKGVLWYQGESNAHNVSAHETLFRLLVQDFRRYFGQEELPIYYMQLSSINRPSWPYFRDSQRRLIDEIPGLGMVVTSDLGDYWDVHPKNKKPIGFRAARWALNKSYGHNICPSGPQVRSTYYRAGQSLILRFDYAEGLHAGTPACRGPEGRYLTPGEKDGILEGFSVWDARDGKLHDVPARIEDDCVILDLTDIGEAVDVRYGWRPYTEANLYNADALPASTFKISL